MSNCRIRNASRLGDGVCDLRYMRDDCNWDDGDCCHVGSGYCPYAVTTSICNVSDPSKLGDGHCQMNGTSFRDEYVTYKCDWDGGDCCDPDAYNCPGRHGFTTTSTTTTEEYRYIAPVTQKKETDDIVVGSSVGTSLVIIVVVIVILVTLLKRKRAKITVQQLPRSTVSTASEIPVAVATGLPIAMAIPVVADPATLKPSEATVASWNQAMH